MTEEKVTEGHVFKVGDRARVNCEPILRDNPSLANVTFKVVSVRVELPYPTLENFIPQTVEVVTDDGGKDHQFWMNYQLEQVF